VLLLKSRKNTPLIISANTVRETAKYPLSFQIILFFIFMTIPFAALQGTKGI